MQYDNLPIYKSSLDLCVYGGGTTLVVHIGEAEATPPVWKYDFSRACV